MVKKEEHEYGDYSDKPVTQRYCDIRHRTNKILSIFSLSMLSIILATGSTLAVVFMNRQYIVADVAESAKQAVQIVVKETEKAEQARAYIKEDVNHIRTDVSKINTKQDDMNVSLRLLIQKVDANGK